MDDGFGENDLFEYYRKSLVGKRIARGGVFQTYRGDYIARVNPVDLSAPVGVHLQKPSDAFGGAAHGIIDVRT